MKNILFCGFGKLGKDCIQKLIDEGYNVCYILTHKELDEESVDTFAIKNNISYSYMYIQKKPIPATNAARARFIRILVDVITQNDVKCK